MAVVDRAKKTSTGPWTLWSSFLDQPFLFTVSQGASCATLSPLAQSSHPHFRVKRQGREQQTTERLLVVCLTQGSVQGLASFPFAPLGVTLYAIRFVCCLSTRVLSSSTLNGKTLDSPIQKGRNVFATLVNNCLRKTFTRG